MILASSGHPLLFLSALSSAILSIITCKQKTAAHKQMSDMLRELIIHLKDRSQMPLKCQSLSHPIRVESNWGHKKSIIKMSHQPVQLPVVVIINTVLWPNVTTCWSFWVSEFMVPYLPQIHRYDGDDDVDDDGDGDNKGYIFRKKRKKKSSKL